MSETVTGADGKQQCQWSSAAPDFLHYHDTEWGFPVGNDQRLFEKLCLETFQSGLSWRTILAKRENFREAFQQFDVEQVSRFKPGDIKRLLKNEGIVRNRAKIEAVINNSRRVLELTQQECSLAAFVWRYEPDPNTLPKPQSVTTSKESVALAKELKKRGWKFVGPTTVYAFMQSMGLLNDHVEGCIIRDKVDRARRQFQRPK